MIRFLLWLFGIGVAITAIQYTNWEFIGGSFGLIISGYTLLVLLARILGWPTTGSVFQSTRAVRWATVGYFWIVGATGKMVSSSLPNAEPGTALFAWKGFSAWIFNFGIDIGVLLILYWTGTAIAEAVRRRRRGRDPRHWREQR